MASLAVRRLFTIVLPAFALVLNPTGLAAADTAVAITMDLVGTGALTASGGLGITLSGTSTLPPIGNATVTGTGTVGAVFNLTAVTPVNVALVFTFATGDTMSATLTVPAGYVAPALGDSTQASGSMTITGGTGKYAGATGTFPKLTGIGTTTGPTSGTAKITGNGTITIPILPAITPSGVISAGAYGAFATASPGSWIEIYGTNLSTTSRTWATADFTNGGTTAPTLLDGVKVTIGGQLAFIDYISPTQINALIPSTVGTGAQQVIVSNSLGTSAAYTLTINTVSPGLLAPPSTLVTGKQYIAAFLPNSQVVRGIPSNPAKAGDTLILYGVGFGAVTPSSNAGTVVSTTNSLITKPQILFGTTPADVAYYGLAPGFTGLYQFNVTVPAVSANTATPLTFNAGGIAGTQTLYIAIQ